MLRHDDGLFARLVGPRTGVAMLLYPRRIEADCHRLVWPRVAYPPTQGPEDAQKSPIADAKGIGNVEQQETLLDAPGRQSACPILDSGAKQLAGAGIDAAGNRDCARRPARLGRVRNNLGHDVCLMICS